MFVLISIMMLAIGVSSWHKGMQWYRRITHILKTQYLYAFLPAMFL